MANIECRPIELHELDELRPDLEALSSRDGWESESQFVRWWFFGHPLGPGVYGGAFDGTKLVGVVGFAPQRIHLRGQELMVAELSSAKTSPEYRGRGIFTRLIRFLISSATERSYELVYGLPNATAHPIYLSKLGFSELFSCVRYTRPVRLQDMLPSVPAMGRAGLRAAGGIFDAICRTATHGLEITVRSTPPDGIRDLQAEAAPECAIRRDPQYLAWRYARPERTYRHVAVHESSGRLVAWACVYTLSGTRLGDRLYVGDYWVSPSVNTATNALVDALRQVALADRLSHVYLVARPSRFRFALERNGFIPRKVWPPLVAISCTNSPPSRFLDWEYRDSDADMF